MIHHRITPTIALTLAFAAATAPTAWANSSPVTPATPVSCGDVCSGHGYGPVNLTPLAPATAVSCGDVCSGHGYGPVNLTPLAPATAVSCGDVCSGHGYGLVTAPAAVVRVVAPSSGFDWGDAGIGAGSMLALTVIGLGGVVAGTNRRRRQTQDPHVSTSS